MLREGVASGVGDAGDRKVVSSGTAEDLPPTKIAAPSKARSHDRDVAAVLELLAETWPHCFSIYENRRRPLKIGIHLDILAALNGAVSAEELAQALRCYVSNKVYRARLVTGAIRIGLAGLPAGTVTETDGLAAKPKPAKSAPATKSSRGTKSPLASNEISAAHKRHRGADAPLTSNENSAGADRLDAPLKSNEISAGGVRHPERSPLISNENLVAKRLSLADLRAAAQARKATAAEAVS
jgi:sRNA-binding protein